MSYTELFDIVMSLTQPQLADLFGAAPTQVTLAQLEFPQLQPVITSIQRMEPNDNPPLTAPSPVIDPRFSYKGEDVVATLDQVCRQIGFPATIRVDNGSEFISRDMDLWALTQPPEIGPLRC